MRGTARQVQVEGWQISVGCSSQGRLYGPGVQQLSRQDQRGDLGRSRTPPPNRVHEKQKGIGGMIASKCGVGDECG